MVPKQVLLDVASFLDSAASLALDAPDRAGQRLIVEAYLGACYEELGLAPKLLDGEGMRSLLTELLPRHFKARDPLAELAPMVIGAFLDHLETVATVRYAFEQRLSLQDSEAAFHEAVARGTEAPARSAKRARPFVHGASKLGRNDPCSCGSGKKYKNCHGK